MTIPGFSSDAGIGAITTASPGAMLGRIEPDCSLYTVYEFVKRPSTTITTTSITKVIVAHPITFAAFDIFISNRTGSSLSRSEVPGKTLGLA
jgi:hypothetical protein